MPKLAAWGSSVGLRIPQQKLREAKMAVGDDVSISVEDGKIIILGERVHYALDDLLDEISDDNLPDQIEFGAPVGRELL